MKAKLILFAMAVALSLPFFSFAEGTNLIINQVQISGDGGASDEFIELYNPSDASVSLTDWSIQYKSSTGEFPLSSGKKNLGDVSIPAKGYLLIGHTDYNGSVAADVTQGSFNMSGSSTGGTVFLVKSTTFIASGTDANIVDKVGYGDSSSNSPETANAALPESEKSISRNANHSDTNNNSVDFAVQTSTPRNKNSGGVTPTPTPSPTPTPTPTPSPTPSPSPCPEPNPSPTPSPTPTPTPTPSPTPSPTPVSDNSGKIVISEIFPRPNNGKPEFVELNNVGGTAVNLKNWTLTDNQKTYTFTTDKILNPGEFLALLSSDIGLTLDDINQDSVTLKDSLAKLVSDLKYEDPEKGYSLSRASNVWFWSKVSTPSAENQILQ